MFVGLGSVFTSSPRRRGLNPPAVDLDLPVWQEAACKAGQTWLWPLNHQHWIPIMLRSASSAPTAAPPVIRLSAPAVCRHRRPHLWWQALYPQVGDQHLVSSESDGAVLELQSPSPPGETLLGDHRRTMHTVPRTMAGCSTSEKKTGWLLSAASPGRERVQDADSLTQPPSGGTAVHQDQSGKSENGFFLTAAGLFNKNKAQVPPCETLLLRALHPHLIISLLH